MRPVLPVCAIAALFAAACASFQHRLPEPVEFPEASFRHHVERLSADEFEGRAPATPGEAKTLAYIEQAFREAGLEPALGTSFLQDVPLVRIVAQPDETMSVTAGDKALPLRFGADWAAWTRLPVPESRLRDAGIVFAGYGIVAPEYRWDDYAGVDVRGKLVLVLVNDPGFATGDPQLFTGRAMTYYGRWTYKYEEALRHGAAGLLVIHETEAAGYPWEVARGERGRPQFDLLREHPERERLPLEGWITHEAAARVLALGGRDYAQLKQAALRRDFRAFDLGLSANVGVRNTVDKIHSFNVVGTVPGRTRGGEHFVYTAHWDHLGVAADEGVGGDRIFNGASDNATGVAALIELARAFARAPRAERSVSFAAVTAEEYGLLGSEYLADHLPVPAAQVVGGLNMDNLYAIGPTRDLTVIGYGASALDEYLRRAAAVQHRVLVPEPTPEKGFYYRSDHFNLARRGIPMLYTKAGVDSPEKGADYGRKWLDDYVANRYHKPSDEYDPGWDVRGIVQDMQLYYEVGAMLANSSDWPEWRADSEFRAIRERSRADVGRAD